MYKKIKHAPDGLKVITADPEIRFLTGALYVPVPNGQKKGRFGLFDTYGRLVPEGAYFRGPHSGLIDQSWTIDVDPVASHPRSSGVHFYMGELHLHYGHFLAGTLPRFWPDRSLYRDAKILFHSNQSFDEALKRPWFRFIVSALELNPEQFVKFERPTIIDEVFIPAPSFGEDHYAHEAFHRLTTTIGNADRTPSPFGERIYLSKTKLEGGLFFYQNESIIENGLKENGYDIVHPEQLTLPEQIALFSDDRIVTGIAGSAFHTSVFVSNARGIGLSSGEGYSANFHLMDAISDARISYVHMECDLGGSIPHPHTFHYGATIRNPDEAIETILASAAAETWEIPTYTSIEPVRDGLHRRLITTHGQVLSITDQTGFLLAISKNEEPGTVTVASMKENRLTIRHPDHETPIGTIGMNSQKSELTFEIIPQDGNFALLSVDNQRYLSAEPGGIVACNRKNISQWELFTAEAF